MKKLLFFGLLTTGIWGVAHAQTAVPDRLDGTVLIKTESTLQFDLVPYDSSSAALNTIINGFGIYDITRPFQDLGNDTLEHTYRLFFSDTQNVNQLMQQLEQLTYVEYAEHYPLYEIESTPNDLHAEQWYLEKINAEGGWNVTTGDESVTIAIVDNAVLIDHEDLKDNLWENPGETENGMDSDLNGYTDDIHGYDVADGNNDPSPPDGFSGGSFSHGTHCAGTASATTNNGIGIAGMGYNTRIISVKCTPDNSEGNTLTHAYEGLRYAVDVDADIISMSWGSRVSSFTGDALIRTARLQGSIMLAAAGNEDSSDSYSPASHEAVMAVAATNENDEKASFSNYGSDVAFCAPGTNIYSTTAGTVSDYGFSNGTSMACPIAAGLAALVKSYDTGLSAEEIRNAIEQGCDDISEQNPDYENDLGAGRINAARTLNTLTSVADKTIDPGFNLYPNPAQNEVFVELQSELEHRYELIKMNGSLVQSGILSSDRTRIVINDLPTGLYLMRITDSNNQTVSTRKISISR